MDPQETIQPPAVTEQRPGRGGPEALAEEDAARRVERWALVAGVTGTTANGLLVALYTLALPGNHDYDWTGPANDVVGAVAALSMIPMAIGVRDLLGSPGRLPLLTSAVAVGGTASAAASALLVTGVVDLRAQLAVWVPWFAVVAAWQRSTAHWGADTGRLSRRLSRASGVIGAAALSGVATACAAALLPWGSPAQLVVGGVAAAAGAGAFFALPVWQLMLSRAMTRQPVGGGWLSEVAR
jgi:hypothetical protein